MERKVRWLRVRLMSLLVIFMTVGTLPNLYAAQSSELEVSTQANKVTVKGKITDASGAMVGVAVTVKGNAVIGTLSNADGTFMLSNVPKSATIIANFLGYSPTEVDLKALTVAEIGDVKITMSESADAMEQISIIGNVSQTKVSVVGAITTIAPQELIAPGRSLSNALAGRVAGMSFSQESGQPGKDGASFVIRGLNSVSGKTTEPLVLIDGLKRTLDDVDPNDIETFAILKDASATAVYGLEGANGIVVITTRNGKLAAKPTVRFSYSSSINNSTELPDWVDAPDYARMRNEAYEVRGFAAPYSDDIISKFGDSDMNVYPNVDWQDVLLKRNNLSQKGNFNISGGGNSVSYYMSAGFYTESGMFKAAEDANSDYSQFNFRSNVKADLTTTTTLALGFDGRYNSTTEPGQGMKDILTVMNNVNPTLFPHEFSNGAAPLEPANAINPYSFLNKTGFVKDYENIMSTNLSLNQKLNFITEGLNINMIAAFSKVNNYRHRFLKQYQEHSIDYENSHLNSGYDENGNLMTINRTPTIDDKMQFAQTDNTGTRTVELQANISYGRTFLEKLNITGLVLYKQREHLLDRPKADNNDATQLLINALEVSEQSIAGRVTLNWDHRYFLDVNGGFSGSQLFTPDKRWSAFPSFGAGWLVSEEAFWSESLASVFDFFKLRATLGFVGDPGKAARFGYLGTTGDYNGYTFGFGHAAGSGLAIQGTGEGRLAQEELSWASTRKVNLGIELGFYRDFKVIVDMYENRNDNQLISLGTLPASLGINSIPLANLGAGLSRGVDIDLSYSKSFGDFSINYVRGIIGYTESEIIENGALDPKVPYLNEIGLDYGRQKTYVALGLFEDQAEIDRSPVQTWNEVLPGDIKYKDIDGDGVITPNDQLYLGSTNASWTYSLSLDLSYKNFTFATRFIGKAGMFRNITAGRIPFNPSNLNDNQFASEAGAVYAAAMNDHWTPEWYSGDPSTENPNAEYPRLAYGINNQNNIQRSTFWLRDASYIRWADIELGYNWVPKSPTAAFKSIYFYTRCDNVATFSKFKDWDPEQTSAFAYPLKRTITLGLEIAFNL